MKDWRHRRHHFLKRLEIGGNSVCRIISTKTETVTSDNKAFLDLSDEAAESVFVTVRPTGNNNSLGPNHQSKYLISVIITKVRGFFTFPIRTPFPFNVELLECYNFPLFRS